LQNWGQNIDVRRHGIYASYPKLNNPRQGDHVIIKKYLQIAVQISILMGLSSIALANECGDKPMVPTLVDGASVTMAELVANSVEVKDFIAAADVYLDCDADFRQSIAYKDLSRSDKSAATDDAKDYLEARNDVGDDFNVEVQAYKSANPDS
jgi:hypothetical protein